MQAGVNLLNSKIFFKKLRKPLDDRFLLFRAVAAAKAGDGRQDLVNIRAGRFERAVAERIGNKALRFCGLQLMVWRQMEKLVEMGLVKSIGMSNMNIPKIESVWQEMKIKPVVNECELHPHLRQDELIAYLKEKNVLPIAHTPLGSPHRPERDRTTEDTNCLQDPAILEIAQAHGIHPVSVVLKWAVQRGTLPVPFSISRSHILSNLQCCTEDLLTNAEMEKINNIGTQCRLIKGTVLLWEGAPDWHCLWDEQGEIDRTGWKG